MNKVKTFRQPQNQDKSRYLEPIINPDGSFFCCACLEDKPRDDQSADPRYCRNCFDCLTYESSLLKEKVKRPFWVPRTYTKSKISGVKAPTPTTPLPQIMHTLKSKNPEVCIIPPPAQKVTREKRGPKHRELPVELITKWASEGMGSKAITTRLQRELNIKVHYSTIQRILSGQRVLV